MAFYSDWKIKETHVFLFIIGLVYTALLVVSSYLHGALWDDEIGFWKTSLEFSNQLLPSFAQIRNYNQFNTPFPFIVYGMLEHLFKAGPFAARLINFVFSIVIAFLIGWPGKKRSSTPIFALLGLFLFPWYLWLSTRLYTDMLASFFVVWGIAFYLKKQHILSGLSFFIAISCRQFMLVFPLAVAFHELVLSIRYRRWPSLSFFLP
ncbi:MAG: hypothetical protein F6J97_18000, partial [Leptolyngbya sp. SIO4C1]|nr:hypothetical protein [Leptolyngbya sp. SIO4C1]